MIENTSFLLLIYSILSIISKIRIFRIIIFDYSGDFFAVEDCVISDLSSFANPP